MFQMKEKSIKIFHCHK